MCANCAYRSNSTAAWAILNDKLFTGGPPLLFLGTHFKAGDNAESAEIRSQQANSLSKVINELKGWDKFFDSAVCVQKNGTPQDDLDLG